MTVAYFDSSALVKLFVREEGSEAAWSVWSATSVPMSSRLAYAEVRAGLAALCRAGVLSAGQLRRAVEAWEATWAETAQVELSTATARRAGELAERHALRGADAVHLASALVAEPVGAVFVAWDVRLREAALSEGLPVVPAA